MIVAGIMNAFGTSLRVIGAGVYCAYNQMSLCLFSKLLFSCHFHPGHVITQFSFSALIVKTFHTTGYS